MAKRRRVVKKAFLDSSVLFTAVNSPMGGSSKLFILKNIKLVVSKVVLAEVEKNVRKKLYFYHLTRFFLLSKKLVILNQLPNEARIKRARKVIVKKDAIILAEARTSRAEYLVTLDKKHFFSEKVRRFLKPQRVVTPKMLIEELEV